VARAGVVRRAFKGEWCELLTCLLGEKAISRELEERLRKEGLNIEGIRRCLRTHCQDDGHTTGRK
jgi:hypothetical protein